MVKTSPLSVGIRDLKITYFICHDIAFFYKNQPQFGNNSKKLQKQKKNCGAK